MLCQSRLSNKKRNLAENLPYVLEQYWKKAHPYDKIHLDYSCEICDQCYFLGRALSKAKSESLDDLKKIVQNAENDISLGDKNDDQILAFNKCLVHVGNKLLKGEAILLPSVFDMFLKEYKTDLVEREPSDSTKRSRWLLSALSTALCDHMDIHRTTGRRLGLLLFRKGSNPLDILHSFMFKICRDAQESNFDLEESLSFVDSSFTLAGSEESTLYEAALILNNILQKHAESAPKSKKGNMDISKVSISSLIENIDSKL